MGRYIDENLAKDEKIIYETRLHWMVFFWSGIWVLLGSMSLFSGFAAKVDGAIGSGVFLLILAAVLGLNAYLNRLTSEFALTDKRVLMKTGFISRSTIEIQLNKIEAILVDQGILGRILNYGSITVSGTGGLKKTFKKISGPIEFKKRVQEHIT